MTIHLIELMSKKKGNYNSLITKPRLFIKEK